MEVFRTPEENFDSLPGYPFAPNFVEVASRADAEGPPLRMHYVDEGDPDAHPVLMLHGEPTWSFSYRKMISRLAALGHRSIAPDHIGFGKSDKPTARASYSFASHIGWIRELVVALDLRNITLFGQDWGGAIGLGVVAEEPDRFARVVVSNTVLHTASSDLNGRLEWSNHGSGKNEVCLAESLLDWILFSQRSEDMEASWSMSGALQEPVTPEIAAAYDAPFPCEEAKAGMRQFPALIPLTRNDPGAGINRATTEFLRTWERPFLTLYSDSDPTTRGWETILQELVPGGADQPHSLLPGVGHFIQEEVGEELASRVDEWIGSTPI
ncbi:MAG: haloalkane dehalogenase [Myxococcota bacterium]|nr:haloalkane dehalogenase [Myxococcota bacterium]